MSHLDLLSTIGYDCDHKNIFHKKALNLECSLVTTLFSNLMSELVNPGAVGCYVFVTEAPEHNFLVGKSG